MLTAVFERFVKNSPITVMTRARIERVLPATFLDEWFAQVAEHRLKALRGIAAVALPGKSLVLYEPELGIPTDVFLGEDGHAQERALFHEVTRAALSDEHGVDTVELDGGRLLCSQ